MSASYFFFGNLSSSAVLGGILASGGRSPRLRFDLRFGFTVLANSRETISLRSFLHSSIFIVVSYGKIIVLP
jgi:hypothetical protein